MVLECIYYVFYILKDILLIILIIYLLINGKYGFFDVFKGLWKIIILLFVVFCFYFVKILFRYILL